MTAPDIRITAEPVDDDRCKFVVSQPLHSGGVRRFASPAEAKGSPLAEAILAIPGISELIVSGNIATVVKHSAAPWTSLGRTVGAAIRAALSTEAPAVAARDTAAPPADEDALYERVADLFETRINPMVGRHGGFVELIDVQDRVVMLRMGGGCQGCGMADVTLRQGIEGMLRQHVPEITGIVDITDHSAGSSPYFAAAKK